MKMSIMAMAGVLMPAAVLAGPVVKIDPVAEGFPDWQGMSAKTFIMGREIGPSDLRHKVAVVVEIEPNEKLQSQLAIAGQFATKVGLNGFGWDGGNWETIESLPRNLIFAVSNRGGGKDKDHEAIKAALKYKGEDTTISLALGNFRGVACSMYDDLTFTGAPDATGKRPYVYVMGPEGKEILFQDTLTADTYKKANAAINKALAKLKETQGTWKPFFGCVEEVKFFPIVAKTIEKGKPLAPVSKALLKDVLSKDAEKAKEAQILYDAIEQTRSDLLLRIGLEASACPHRAYYDVQKLLRYWPSEKKRLDSAMAKIKANPESLKLAQMFCKLMTWAGPDFTCKNAGEAKKIVAELNKMKKDLEKLQESKVIVVQNGALTMATQVDELIALIPTKVPEK